jgi:two-component system cell cycle response regulator
MKERELVHHFPILVAEDNPVSRKLLKKTLVRAGHEVTSAQNGRKALELFNERFFPIVLTDWIMPEMEGLKLCRAIRKNASTGYVFIILLTAKNSKDDIITGLEAGADDYPTKPFHRAELIARLNTGKRILELERSLKRANEGIRILSITDSLTESYNSGYMTERLPQEIKRSRRYRHSPSLVLCDIDHFKNVNDTYGHQAGDLMLKEFVRCIIESIRDNVDCVVRYGGEEFLIVFPEKDVQGASCMAERLRSAISQKVFKAQEKWIHITASFGVTGLDPTTPYDEISLEVMISQADRLLYQAKQEGKNRIKAGQLYKNSLNRKEVMT